MKLAVFDFDGTLFFRDTLPFLLKLWRKFGYPKRRLLLVAASLTGLLIRYKLFSLGHEEREKAAREVMNRFTRIFAGMTYGQVEEFFLRCAPVIIKRLKGAVVEEIGKAKGEGFKTVLLSGCYESLLEKIGEPLGIDIVIGTRINYRNGTVDLGEPLDVVYGEEKAVRIRRVFGEEGVDWEKSMAFADSFSDLPLLKLVGVPVAVDPDPELEKTAVSLKWRIISTEKPPRR